MKKPVCAIVCLLLGGPLVWAQEPTGPMLEIRGDGRPAQAEKLFKVWLYPEDYVGTTIKLHGFLFEPQNFEYFPEQNGHLFCCEAVIHKRDSDYHTYVGNATFLSQDKLNFFCTTADGQRIRELFKTRPAYLALAADVVLEVQRRDHLYFGVVTSFKPDSAPPPMNPPTPAEDRGR